MAVDPHMKLVPLFAVALTVGACESRDPVAKGAENTDGLPVVTVNSNDPSGAPPAVANSAGSAPAAETLPAAIPASLQGRWALAPADCTSTLGDAKGLLVIDGKELRFYESRAVPAARVQAAADSLSADFAFTGEGMTWTKFQTLTVKNDKLVRTESSPMASFTYARCE